MEKVYVTESGFINEFGHFESIGVIGVDRTAKNAVNYIYDCYKALPIERILNEGGITRVTYKVEGSTQGFRISIHNL